MIDPILIITGLILIQTTTLHQIVLCPQVVWTGNRDLNRGGTLTRHSYETLGGGFKPIPSPWMGRELFGGPDLPCGNLSAILFHLKEKGPSLYPVRA